MKWHFLLLQCPYRCSTCSIFLANKPSVSSIWQKAWGEQGYFSLWGYQGWVTVLVKNLLWEFLSPCRACALQNTQLSPPLPQEQQIQPSTRGCSEPAPRSDLRGSIKCVVHPHDMYLLCVVTQDAYQKQLLPDGLCYHHGALQRVISLWHILHPNVQSWTWISPACTGYQGILTALWWEWQMRAHQDYVSKADVITLLHGVSFVVPEKYSFH